jgi:hypothetical protein
MKSIIVILLFYFTALNYNSNGQIYVSGDSIITIQSTGIAFDDAVFRTSGYGSIDFFQRDNVVTDSIIWYETSTARIGDTLCKHNWVYGNNTTASPMYGCLVLHHGFHCSYDDGIRDKVCKKCGRLVTEREQWYQHRQPPPKSEFQITNEKFSKP